MKRNPYRPALFAGSLLLALAPALSAHADGSSKSAPPAKTASKLAVPKLDDLLTNALKTAPEPSQWPNSNYARLLDIGDVTVRSDGTVVARYRETYKLFNERARTLAEVNLPYNATYQDLRVISARTIKKDGTVLTVKPEDIRETAQMGDYLLYDDAKGIGFSMPGIEDGCVIDYTFETITHPLLMPGQFTAYWGFTDPMPVSLCRYTLHTPADKAIKYKVYNDDTLQPTITASGDGHTKTYVWERTNLKPIEVEPSMPGVQDVRTWMEISSLDSWQNIAQWFWQLQQPQAKPTDAIRATVAGLTKDAKTDDDRARAIYDWVANRTRYVGLEFGISAYKPHAASEVHDKLYGDCKDKANLLITMLGVVGIKAHPVLLHAEERRPVGGGLPTLNAFNHCIALADVSGKEVWLDSTAETCAYGDIPDGDRGVEAFVVKDGKGEFKTIPMYQPEQNGVDVALSIALQPDGGAVSNATVTMKGEAGQGMRASVRSITPDQRKEMMQRVAQAYSSGGKISDFNLPDGQDKNGPFVMTMKLTAPTYGRKTGSLLLLPLGGGTIATRRNPYSKETRVWPIVQEDAGMAHSQTTLTLPDGYTIEDVPGDVHLSSPFQDYTRTIKKADDGKTITITDSFSERPGKIPASDYAKIKTFYDKLIELADDQIVLKKK